MAVGDVVVVGCLNEPLGCLRSFWWLECAILSGDLDCKPEARLHTSKGFVHHVIIPLKGGPEEIASAALSNLLPHFVKLG